MWGRGKQALEDDDGDREQQEVAAAYFVLCMYN